MHSRTNGSDPYLVNLFMQRFGGSDRALPNMEAKDIRRAIEDGDYRTATELLIEYFGENSVQALNSRIHELRDRLSSADEEIRCLTESNDAELAEKVKLFDTAREAVSIVKRFLDFDIRGSDIDCMPMRELLEDAESLVNRVDSEGLTQ